MKDRMDNRPDSVIFVIDDNIESLRLLDDILSRNGYEARFLSNGFSALKLSQKITPALILLDITMPDMDGFTTAQQFKQQQHTQDVPIIFISALSNIRDKAKAFEQGGVDYITKPYDELEVILRINTHLELSEARQELLYLNLQLAFKNASLQEINARSQEEMLHRLAMIGEKHDDTTGKHMLRVGEYSYLIAKALQISEDEAQMLRKAAPLHDIGKIAIRDSILLKPDKLTPKEFEVIKLHTTIGAQMLSESVSPAINLAETIALSHHERWNGSGYPYGLKGKNIPLWGRIVAIADAYDALTNKRPYKEAWSHEQALEELKACSGTHYDPDIMDAFLSINKAFQATNSQNLQLASSYAY
ncbi:MAG: response regulator [Deinococcales bacterium]